MDCCPPFPCSVPYERKSLAWSSGVVLRPSTVEAIGSGNQFKHRPHLITSRPNMSPTVPLFS